MRSDTQCACAIRNTQRSHAPRYAMRMRNTQYAALSQPQSDPNTQYACAIRNTQPCPSAVTRSRRSARYVMHSCAHPLPHHARYAMHNTQRCPSVGSPCTIRNAQCTAVLTDRLTCTIRNTQCTAVPTACCANTQRGYSIHNFQCTV